ncbi:MAG: SIS domain-containing protein [Nitrososphaera sp.]|uniref:SIS domain-containing protein n=1 Tax=Nitrososphaera sp. TaxID=1971748 RepID=UPI003D6EE814
MNSVEAMAADMERQLVDLQGLELARPRGRIALVGSGDSYVAALAAHHLSSGRASCHHPADIVANPSFAQGRDVYIVSISGRTQANVLAAKAARRAGLHTVAVTVNGKSPLAKACDDVAELKFRSAGRTAGTISFTASILACAWLATKGKVACPANLAKLYNEARKQASRLPEIRTDSIVVLADSVLHPAAKYGALKFNEIFGARAIACQLEDFFHAPLFGLKKGDKVLILGGKARARQLQDSGFDAHSINCTKPTAIESLLYAVFFIQHLALRIATRRGMGECHFISDKRLLKLSSGVIY